MLPDLPRHGQWATFLRNHDEVDLSGLSPEDRQAVFDAFGPDDEHRLYGRGICRRLAPMLDGDQRRLRLAYSLQLTMPGTPVIRYGDEIGMGEDFAHNLAPGPVKVALPELSDEDGSSVEIFSDQEYPGSDLRSLELDGYGFRWIRLRRTHAHW